jgi:hypothetical protein
VDTPPTLRASRWFWPLVLFPYAVEDSHTRTFTGRAVLGGIKGSLSRAVVVLTDDAIEVRGRFTRREHLRVPLDEIRSADLLAGRRGIVEIHFGDARWGKLARLVTSGSPAGSRNRVLLNVDDPDTWVSEIVRHTVD